LVSDSGGVDVWCEEAAVEFLAAAVALETEDNIEVCRDGTLWHTASSDASACDLGVIGRNGRIAHSTRLTRRGWWRRDKGRCTLSDDMFFVLDSDV
jgi:hypothetical protein